MVIFSIALSSPNVMSDHLKLHVAITFILFYQKHHFLPSKIFNVLPGRLHPSMHVKLYLSAQEGFLQ